MAKEWGKVVKVSEVNYRWLIQQQRKLNEKKIESINDVIDRIRGG